MAEEKSHAQLMRLKKNDLISLAESRGLKTYPGYKKSNIVQSILFDLNEEERISLLETVSSEDLAKMEIGDEVVGIRLRHYSLFRRIRSGYGGIAGSPKILNEIYELLMHLAILVVIGAFILYPDGLVNHMMSYVNMNQYHLAIFCFGPFVLLWILFLFNFLNSGLVGRLAIRKYPDIFEKSPPNQIFTVSNDISSTIGGYHNFLPSQDRDGNFEYMTLNRIFKQPGLDWDIENPKKYEYLIKDDVYSILRPYSVLKFGNTAQALMLLENLGLSPAQIREILGEEE